MTTKEYLMQVPKMKRAIEGKAEQINSLRSTLTSISVGSNDIRVQSSSDPDKMASMIANILDREAELEADMKEYLAKQRLIASQIDSLDNVTYRSVLNDKYICDLTFEKIAVATSKTWRHIIRIHGRALSEFEKKFGETYKKS